LQVGVIKYDTEFKGLASNSSSLPHVTKPMRPCVSPQIRAAPEAISLICSPLCTPMPSDRAW
jgi:hypothetical protein